MIWQSILGVFLLLFILNLIPGINNGIVWLGEKIMPAVFDLHVILFFTVFLNIFFVLITKLLPGGSKRKSRIR